MKHIIILLLFFISYINYSQKKDCCNSLINSQNNKNFFIKVSTQKKHDVYKLLVNSNINNRCYSNLKCFKILNNKGTEIEKLKPFDWYELYKNLITIFLGLVAAFVALWQAKSNIISSARIKWNEDLREALSKLYSAALDTHLDYVNYFNSKNNNSIDSSSHYNNYSNNLSTFNLISNKVLMLLNSNEKEHRNIEVIIDKIDKMLGTTNISSITQQSLEVELKKIVENSKIIFKKEWEKSKKVFKH